MNPESMRFQKAQEHLDAGRWQQAVETLIRLAVESAAQFPSVTLEIDRVLRRYAGRDAGFTFARSGPSASSSRWLKTTGWSFDSSLFADDGPPFGDTVFEALAQEAAGGEPAVCWAFRRARGDAIDALDLLLARHLRSEPVLWLRHLNRYLERSGGRLGLAQGEHRDRFASLLTASEERRIEEGPLVSVIMPVHDAARTLRQAARSVLDQTWRPLELILVDDASTDDSAAICRALRAEDPRVKVHHQPINAGPYVCRNVGLRLAQGRYVTCHDVDDLALPYRIAHQVGLLEKGHTAARITSSRMIRLAQDGEPTRPARVGALSHDGFAQQSSASLLFEREHFDTHLGAWDNVRVGGDAELVERAYLCPGGVHEDDRIVMVCLDSPQSLTRDPVLGPDNLDPDSPRAAYQRAWRRSHAVRTPDLRLPCLPAARPFPVPREIEVRDLALKKVYTKIGVSPSPVPFPAPLAAPDVALATALPRLTDAGSHPRKGTPEHALFEANELVRHVGHEAAIHYADQNLPASLRYAAHILRANAALERHDEGGWLEHLNHYLRHYDIAPVRLRKGASLLARFTTEDLPVIEQGPLVTVIMPAWNAAGTVEEAAGSVLSQTWQPIELIIVDDASTDDTWTALCRLRDRDPRVRILRNRRNVGPYVSKNIALMSARGKFVTGHDSDDWAHPQRIEHHVRSLLHSQGAVRASVGYMLRLTPEGRFSFITRTNDFSFDGAARKALISCMFRHEDLKQRLGFWDTVRFAADSEMMSRAQALFGAGFQAFPSIGMLCLDHADGLTNDPVHGIRVANGGLSDSRKAYRDSWLSRHRAGLSPEQAFLEFPQKVRRYPAVEGVAVPFEDQIANLNADVDDASQRLMN